ncbi:MAG: Ig-like domain-containing protein [ANME-2 cluster archaeon]|nr:Ig-like domain-containing protein [ANME-2 cluster archaeon]
MKNIIKGIILLVVISFFILLSQAAPQAPTGVTASDFDSDAGGKINVTWTKSTDDGAGGNVTTYEILRSETNASGSFISRGTLPNGSQLFEDNTSDGTPYWYKVNASDGNNSSSSSVVGPVQSKENIPPVISSVINGTVTDSTAVIQWTTDEASTTVVDYDIDSSVPYAFHKENLAPVTSHTITLTGLDANTTYYYIAMSTDPAGNTNTSVEYNFTTTVDTTKPNVTSTNPSNGQSGISRTTTVTAIFSEAMNVSTIDNTTFTLTGPSGSIPGNVSYNTVTRTATFTPDAILDFGGSYTATVTTAVTDLIGNAMNANNVWTFTTLGNQAPAASLNSVSPPDGVTPVTFNFSVTFTDAENESLSNVKLYIDGVDYIMNQVDTGDLTTDDGKDYKLTKTISAVGKYDYYFEATDSFGNTGQSTTKNFEVFSATYYSGDRIWSEGMSTTYTWNPQSFSGFYYDLDTNEGSETLTIKGIDRSLSRGDIIYETSPLPIKFDYGGWGTYDVIGFMADRYFAGYNDTSFASSGDNLLDKRKLSKVLTDNDNRYTVRAGSVLDLEEGYEFRITEFGISGSAVMVGLFKDGGKVKEDIVSEDDTFVYKKDLGSARDMPVLTIHIDTVFAGMETSTVIVEGIFQISERYIDVDRGDTFGEMEVTGVSSSGITMKNEDSVSLDEGDDFNLMGKINIIVADDPDTLRFAPYVEMSEPGTYELRGTVTEDTTFDWTPFNFGALLYDIDSGDGDETLSIARSGRTVAENKLVYTTRPIDMKFEHSGDGWNEFQSIGFMGDIYFSGYKSSSFLSSDRSLIEEGRLSKILIDEDKRYTLHIGNSLPLQEGYSVRIDEISRSGEALMFTILKNGEEIDTDISGGDDTFVYEVEVGDTDIPIFIIHIDQVFRGMETNSVFIDGVFQISEKFTTVEKGDSYGIMEVTSTTSSSIVMTNKDDSITLGEGDIINIMSDIKIKVADASTVRFYPFKEIVVEEPLYLELDIPPSVYQNEDLTIKVTSDGDEIKGAAITFGNTSIGTTDSSGELTYTPTESGTFTVTASLKGYVSDDDEIEVLYQPKVLLVSAPLVSDRGESIVISVTSEGVGVKDASVKFGSKNLGTTPASGNITYTPDEVGTFTISVSKSGYQDATKDIDITDPGAKLVFSNLSVKPRIVEPGENVNITVEAANFGTLREAQTMYLKVNGKDVVSQDLVLGPGEIVTIHFNMNRSKAGTYLVEVDGRTSSFRVKGLELGTTGIFVIGIIALLSIIAIIFGISEGTLTMDMITAKIQAFEKMLRQLVEK